MNGDTEAGFTLRSFLYPKSLKSQFRKNNDEDQWEELKPKFAPSRYVTHYSHDMTEGTLYELDINLDESTIQDPTCQKVLQNYEPFDVQTTHELSHDQIMEFIQSLFEPMSDTYQSLISMPTDSVYHLTITEYWNDNWNLVLESENNGHHFTFNFNVEREYNNDQEIMRCYSNAVFGSAEQYYEPILEALEKLL